MLRQIAIQIDAQTSDFNHTANVGRYYRKIAKKVLTDKETICNSLHHTYTNYNEYYKYQRMAMLDNLKLKEKGSIFHQYVAAHLSIGQNDTNEHYQEYATKFDLWLKDFKFSHGELDTQRSLDIKKIENVFNVDLDAQSSDIFKFVYALESFYTNLLTLCAAKKLDSEFQSERINDYLSFEFFRKLKVYNYFAPSHVFTGTNSKNLFGYLSEVAKVLEGLSFDRMECVDLIREIFHEIYPREIRHSLGEFYTPDWMAQHITNVNEDRLLDGVILDPTCGSGTFLVTALDALNKKSKNKASVESILGFDINPVSTFAAKTNLIINSGEYQISGKILPIFQANILDYKDKSNVFANISEALGRIKEISDRSNSQYSGKEISELEDIGATVPSLSKNMASLVIGNPPWVNWEYLPKSYKEKYTALWQEYGLFDYTGINSIFIKQDISSLITYVTIGHYLKNEGHISFIVKESLFKSIKQAAGFRKFYLKNIDCHFRIHSLEDLTGFNPFNGVSNNTVILHAQRDYKTQYPIPYKIWEPEKRFNPKDTDSISTVEKKINFVEKSACPADPSQPCSGWASLEPAVFENLSLLTGSSDYTARTGVFTGGANGIYWLNILDADQNVSKIENITERAKIKFEKISTTVENTFLFPYASGSDIKMWSYKYGKYIVCPHTAQTKMYPIPMEEIEKHNPLTASYFRHFEDGLKKRKGFTSFDRKIHDAHFYTLQRIGDYTFSRYKVAWKYISSTFTCAVIQDVDDAFLGRKTVIPNEKIIYIGLDDKSEAYYLCGLLSSSYIRELIDSFKVSTQIAPSTIKHLNLPKFDSNNEYHVTISNLCEKGHKDTSNIEKYIEEIDANLFKALESASHKNSLAFPASIIRQAGSGSS